MKLHEYNTLSEKEDSFEMISGTARIHYNLDLFFEKIENIYNFNLVNNGNPNFAFRGVPEAKFKLYSSAQRFFYENGIAELNKKAYEDSNMPNQLKYFLSWINSIRDEGLRWQGGVIHHMLLQLITKEKEDSTIPIFSYLRHYGVPSPVIDFSINPYIALFFAIEEAIHRPSNNEIDNYISLYVVDINYLNKCAEQFQKTSYFAFLNNEYGSYNPFKVWTKFNSNIATNLNILNQEGCLISNILLSDSLEASYKEFIENINENNVDPILVEKLNSKQIISCYNIHKGLIPSIRNKLKELGITNEYVFPNPSLMKEDITDKATIAVLRNNMFLNSKTDSLIK